VIVRCTSIELTSAQRAKLGTAFPRDKAEQLTIDRDYVVLGLQYDVGSILWGTGAWVQLPLSQDKLLIAPLYLFEIIDPRPSPNWEIQLWEDGAITLWPADFYRDYFHGDLEAGKPDALRIYKRVLEAEKKSNEARASRAPRWSAGLAEDRFLKH
jgi:hypothetical protein